MLCKLARQKKGIITHKYCARKKHRKYIVYNSAKTTYIQRKSTALAAVIENTLQENTGDFSKREGK